MTTDTPVRVASEPAADLAATPVHASPTGDGARRVPPDNRRTALARSIVRILERAVADPAALALVLEGGDPQVTHAGPAARATARIQGPAALARMLWPPTPDAFAEGYLRGDVDIDGDMRAAVDAGQALDARRLDAVDLRRLVRYGAELRRSTPAAEPLRRTIRLAGRRHSRARDLAAIRFHYDVGEDFYGLWLDRRLTYSCAYFERPDDPVADLDAAQEAKLELVCRKLDLRPGMRLLDIGCGWGSLLLFAAERYGVESVGVTLSEPQAAEANRRAAAAGLGERVRAEVRDYRDLAALGTFDAVASIGMVEHVGRANLRTYFAAARDALAPGGRFLNHGIVQAARPRRPGPTVVPRPRFVDRFVFPDSEVLPLEMDLLAGHWGAGFEVLDVQSLRPHYALTLAAWVARLEAAWPQAVQAAGEEVARTWRLYMSAAQLGFEHGGIDVAQVLLARPVGPETPAPRPLRPWW